MGTRVKNIRLVGGDVVLRIPANDPTYLKRVLDMGVRSIMAPMISSVTEAEALVRACRYPPHGERGYAAPIVRASRFGADTDYARHANEQLLLIAQIEHVDALSEVEAIAGVEGLDMLCIGPNDLAAAMGYLEQLEHPEVRAQIESLEQRITAAGTLLGTITAPTRGVAELAEAGYQFVAGPNDIALMAQGLREQAAQWRTLTSDFDLT